MCIYGTRYGGGFAAPFRAKESHTAKPMKSGQLSAGSHYLHPAESQPMQIASSQRSVNQSRLRPASWVSACTASQELAHPECI